MLLSWIKNIFSFFDRKKKCGNDYLKSEINLHALPGQSSHQSGKYAQQKNRFVHFWQLLTAKKRVSHDGYKGSVSSRKLIFKVVGLATIAFTLLLFVLIGGGQLILNKFESSPIFKVSDIVFSSTGTISDQKLREASGIILHQTSLIGLNCSQVEAWLVTVPWVARAVVKRNWPSTVEISIVENIPVALLHSKNQGGAQLQYIDGQGMPFLQVRPGGDIDFPVITGLTEIDEPIVREKALAEVLVFLKSVSGNNPYLPVQSVSEIHVNRDGEMVVYLVEYPFPIFFGNSNIRRKYSRLVQVLKALYKKQNGKESISQIEYIQMDYLNDKVLVAQSESG
jgi:cell division septal protein FtsQ